MPRTVLGVVVAIGLVGACAAKTAAPSPRATIAPPEVEGGGAVVVGPYLVDDGTNLYLMPAPKAKLTPPIVVPADAVPLAITTLAAALDQAGIPRTKKSDPVPDNGMIEFPGLPVVMAGATRADRVGAVADALWVTGRCMLVATNAHGGLAAIGERCSMPNPSAPDESVQLTVFAGTDRYWVGISRINEFQPIEDRDHRPDLDKLRDALKQNKASAFFADRVDVELSAEPTRTYADLVPAAQLANEVGFREVRLVSKPHAAAVPNL